MLAPDLRVDNAFRRILLILQPTQSSDPALVMIFSSIRLLLPEPQLEQIAKVLDFAFCNCTQSTVAVSPLNALASGYSEPYSTRLVLLLGSRTPVKIPASLTRCRKRTLSGHSRIPVPCSRIPPEVNGIREKKQS